MLVVASRSLGLRAIRITTLLDDTRSLGRQRVKRGGVRGDGVGDGAAVDQKGLEVEVVDRVTCPVVVLVKGGARGAPVQGSLCLGLDLLGAREQAARRDADVQEGPVVGAAVELGGLRGQALALKVLLEEGLCLGGSRGAAQVKGGPIAVVDGELVVGRGDHVEVEVQADLVEVLGAGLVDVVFGAQQAKLLGGPPGETDGVGDLVLGELKGDLENTDSAGPVVVDARSCLDRVGMGTHEDDVIGVARLGLGDNVHTEDLPDQQQLET
jgi:hypothetical protein